MHVNDGGNSGTTISILSSVSKRGDWRDPVILRHLKFFQFFGSNPLSLEIGRFTEISKWFFTLISIFQIFHTGFFVYHLTELENEAPFRTALGVFRRSAFSLGPALSFYKFIKNRFKFGETLDKLVTIQQIFGITTYKMFLPIKLYTILALATSMYRFVMGLITMLYDHGELSEAIKRLESAVLSLFSFACASNFTYLVKCNSACVQHLSRCGLNDGANEPRIRRYIKMYTRLVSISEGINSYYNACISFVILGNFLNFMDSTSDLLSTKKSDVIVSVWEFFKISFGLSGVLLLVVTCQSATDEAENCNEVLYTRLIQLKSLPVENNIHSFVVMHLGAEKTIRYKLCDSFAINYNLAISMAAAYVTYITVMFQLDHVASETVAGGNMTAVGY